MTSTPTLGVVIVAAGSGVRFGDAGKALVTLAGRPLLAWSVSLFSALPETVEIVVVAGDHTIDRCETLLADVRTVRTSVTRGGESRAGR